MNEPQLPDNIDDLKSAVLALTAENRRLRIERDNAELLMRDIREAAACRTEEEERRNFYGGDPADCISIDMDAWLARLRAEAEQS